MSTAARTERAAVPARLTVPSLPRTWLRADYGAVAGIVAALVAMNTWWIVRYRVGGLVDIDEAGYLATSLEYPMRAKSDGLIGIWNAYQGHAPSAPLVPFAASLVYGVTGAHYMFAFIVLIVAMVATAICSALLAYRMGGTTAAIVAALAVAGTPALIDFTRAFQFALPVAACFTGAVLCMAASERLRSTPLAVAWGVLLGLMLLSRTMTVAFLPGFLVAGIVVALTSRHRSRSFVNLGLGILAAVLVAGTWYAGNWPAVRDYLLNFGYGAQSQAYGGGVPLSPEELMKWVRRQVNEYVYLPLAVVLFAGGVTFVVLLAMEFRKRRGSLARRIAWLAGRERVTIAIPVAAGFAALMSSENQGTGFIVPLLPVATVLAIVSLSKLPWPRARLGALSLVVLVSVCGIAGKSGLPPFDGGPITANLPVYGLTVITDPMGQIQLYEFAGGYRSATLSPPAGDAAWRAAEKQAVRDVNELAKRAGAPPFCAFGFQDRFFSPYQLWLESLQQGTPVTSTWVQPRDATSAAQVRVWLDAGAARPANVLITAANMGRGEIPPAIDQKTVEDAATTDGFQKADHMKLPNGTLLTFWVRTAAPTRP